MVEPNTPEADLKAIDFGWVAGFLEGEGSFRGSSVTAVQVQLEPLERLQKWFGGKITPVKDTSRQPNQKPYSRWAVNGQKARWLMSIIHGLMSPKRQEQISTQLAKPGYWDFYCRNGHAKFKENLVPRSDSKSGYRCRFCRNKHSQEYNARQRVIGSGS